MRYVVAHARKVGTAVGLENVSAHNCREAVYDKDGRPLGELPDFVSHPERAAYNQGDRCGGLAVLKRRTSRLASVELPRKPQKNAAWAVELNISGSAEWFDTHTPAEWQKHFKDARLWLEDRYGPQNLLHWAVHCDEKTPHMHVLFVPLTTYKERKPNEEERAAGKKNKTVRSDVLRYSSSAFLGGRQGLRRLQTELADDVGEKHGLERGVEGSKARHTDQYQWAAQTARNADTLAIERGALDLRAKELDKREAGLTQRESTAKKREESAAALLDRATAERETTAKLIAEYPNGKVLEIVKDALYGLDKDGINASWKAMKDTAEGIRQKQALTRAETMTDGRGRGR